MSGVHAGYAIRRSGSCKQGENGTSAWGKYHACCPGSLKIDHYGNNWQCDTAKAAVAATCADPSWTLWQSKGHGWVCCEDNLVGFYTTYNNTNGTYGCDTQGFYNKNKAKLKLELGTRSSTNSDTSSSSGTNKGAIIGGAVGGVCFLLILAGLIWFFLRRRRNRRTRDAGAGEEESRASNVNERQDADSTAKTGPSELEGDREAKRGLYDPAPIRTELSADDDRSRQELAGDVPANVKQTSPTELPA